MQSAVAKLKKEHYRILVCEFVNTQVARSIYEWSGRNGRTPSDRRRESTNDTDALDAV